MILNIDKYISKEIVPGFAEVDGNKQKQCLEYLDGFNLHLRTGCQNSDGINMNEMSGTLGFSVNCTGFPVIYRNEREISKILK